MTPVRAWAAAAAAAALLLGSCFAGSPSSRRGTPSSQGTASPTAAGTPSFGLPPAGATGPKRIAFVRFSDGRADLYVMDADGSSVERLTRQSSRAGDAVLGGPVWSPDGTRIAYSRGDRPGSDPPGDSTVWIVRPDGSEPERLAGEPAPITAPVWSPDGRWIAFLSGARVDGGSTDLFVLGVHGEKMRLRDGGPGLEDSPRWSSDGSAVAYERSGAMYWVRADGTGGETPLFPQANGAGFAIAPDGTRVAFHDSSDDSDRIDVMGIDGSARATLVVASGKGGAAGPQWSPDGTRIAYEGGGDVWVVSSAGGQARRVTSRREPDSGPRWSPDGATLLYLSGRCTGSCRVRIRSVRADGSQDELLTPAAATYQSPAWSP